MGTTRLLPLALPLLLALGMALPAAAQTEYKVPDHGGDDVEFFVRYWLRYAEGDVKVVIEESDGSTRGITEDDYASIAAKNASFSPAYSTVNSGGTVGVIIVPLDRGGKVDTGLTTKEVVGYIGAFVTIGAALGAAVGAALAIIFFLRGFRADLSPGTGETPDP